MPKKTRVAPEVVFPSAGAKRLRPAVIAMCEHLMGNGEPPTNCEGVVLSNGLVLAREKGPGSAFNACIKHAGTWVRAFAVFPSDEGVKELRSGGYIIETPLSHSVLVDRARREQQRKEQAEEAERRKREEAERAARYREAMAARKEADDAAYRAHVPAG